MGEGPYKVEWVENFGWRLHGPRVSKYLNTREHAMGEALAWNTIFSAGAASRDAEVEVLRAALTDMLSGWKYIRHAHGDLYGVGWDRAQSKAEAALNKDTP